MTNQDPDAMPTMTPAKKHLLRTLIAAAVLGTSAQAHACRWYDVACKARQAAEKAKEAADAAAAAAKAAADKAAAEAKALADKAAAEAAAFAAASATIGSAEAGQIAAGAKSAYASSTGAVQSGYNQSVNAIKAVYNAALEALFRSAGRAFISNEQAALKAIATKMRHLDAEGQQALNRIRRAIPAKQVTDQMRSDMATLGAKLGLLVDQANANIPGNVRRSSWGIYTGAGIADGIGVNESYALVMNTFMENGKYAFGFTRAVGVTAGPSIGASGEAGVFWAPGSIDDAAGPSVGFGAEIALPDDGGAAIGLDWSISMGMSGAQNAIPGISIAFTPGAELSASFGAGYTHLLGKFN